MRGEDVAKGAGRKMFREIGMRDLTERMHAGIGTALAMNANLLATDRLDRRLQRTLHRGAIVLNLPAAERRAVIFDEEFVTGHCRDDLFRLSWPGIVVCFAQTT